MFVYAFDTSNPQKRRRAQDLLRRAVAGDMIASMQVLAEFAAVLLHKLSPPARPADVAALLDVLGPIKLVQLDGDTIRRAVQAGAKYGVHFYDGMIVAAAERGGCRRIWSEDLNAGQKYFEILVENPFR